MISHAPKNYICPFCAFVKNTEAEGVLQVQQDIIYQDHFITAFISPKWWEKNPGNVIIIPNEHFENIYDLPNELGYKIHDAAKEVAIALKTVYKCDGVSTRQHNEPQEIKMFFIIIFMYFLDIQMIIYIIIMTKKDLFHRKRDCLLQKS